jgi:beta-lactamase regulating signal transducer with metallopeptidase domain
MILLLRVTVLLVAGEAVCWALARLAPRARPMARGLTLAGAVLLPWVAALAPTVRFVRLPADGFWSVPSVLPAASAPLGWLVAVWAVGAALRACALLGGQWRLQRLLRRARTLRHGRAVALCGRIASRMGLRGVRILRRPDAGAVPFTAGLLMPAIVLPRGSSRWPSSRLEAVLVHELEHVRRRDVAARLGAELACCLYWFHPAALWHAWRLRVESELACDQAVLAAGARPSRYASDLLAFATQSPMALGFSDRRTLSERVRSILAPPRPARAPGAWSRAAVAAIAVGLTIGAACYEPTATPRPAAAGIPASSVILGARRTQADGSTRLLVTVRSGAPAAHGRSPQVVVCTTR